MNKYVRKLFSIVLQSPQTPQVVRGQPQHSLASPEEWHQHWQSQGQPWRTEPEIDAKRQEELSKRRTIVPDIEKGIYPFKGVKLSRADVEWLLVTHENGRGPVDWSDMSQRKRSGLDLRGADLSTVDLRNLPLACMIGGLGGLSLHERSWTRKRKSNDWTGEQYMTACVLLEKTFLLKTHLEGALLSMVNFEGATIVSAYFEEADLGRACLASAKWTSGQLFFEKANLSEANLEGLRLFHLKGAHLAEANMKRVKLFLANLEDANLYRSHLEDADISSASLKGANIVETYLGGCRIARTKLDGARLERVTLTNENHIGPSLLDVHWGDINLTAVNWSQIKILGNEGEARQKKGHDGKLKDKATRLREHEEAVRANRQLAVTLDNQGLSEDAARFAYRARVLQRRVFWRQRHFWKWLGSAILALLAGYGYRIWRIFMAYLLIVSLCAAAYFVLGMHYEPHLTLLEALLTSITAFHGRVFSEPFLQPGEPQLWVTAFEAVAGLVIEGVFIAMLTQKFFGK